jgi:Predicted outer membrane protein
MRKILFIIFCLFALAFKVEAASYEVKKIPTGVYSTKTVPSGSRYTSELQLLYVGDKIAYCIEPGVILKENSYEKLTSFKDAGIGDEVKNEIELIAYYGYEYEGHNIIQFYMAAQEMIWEKLGAKGIGFSFEGNYSDTTIYKEVINNLVKKHNELPSFAFKEFEVKLGEKLELKDDNNVIHTFKTENKNSTVENDKLIVEYKKVGEYSISFVQNKKIGSSFAYGMESSQKLGTFNLESENRKNFEIKVKVLKNKGNIKLIKRDSETELPLEKAEFEILNENKVVINKGKTNKIGELVFKNYDYGKYFIREITAPNGYIKLTEDIELELKEEENIVIINNVRHSMPVTSNTDREIYSKSTILLLIGVLFIYVYKKIII